MPVVFIQEFAVEDGNRSTTNYDAIAARLEPEAGPPDGLLIHTAGFDDDAGVFRILDVWESRDHAQRFFDERLQPILDEGPADPSNAAPPTREGFYELHHVVGG